MATVAAMTDIDIKNNPEQKRYEALVDGRVAGFVDYEIADGLITLVHTEVDSEFEGQGVGDALARGSLDDIRAESHHRRVQPDCPFIAKWIGKHPDYRELVIGVGGTHEGH